MRSLFKWWAGIALGTPCWIFAAPAFAQQGAAAPAGEQRQLGAHMHGQGKLSIAIEKRTVEIELEAPGSDIVGFEHEAKTAEHKAAISKARATLAKPLALFMPTDAAGCKQTSAKVKLISGGHDHGHGHGHGHAKQAAGKQAEPQHSEFHAEYVLTCLKPDALTELQSEYFKAFPSAQSLEVSLIGPKGQSKQAVTRDKPVILLK